MVEQTPLWTVLLVPVVVGTLAAYAASCDAALAATAEGRRISRVDVVAPLRGAVRLLLQHRRLVPRADVALLRIGAGGIGIAAMLAAAVVPVGGYVVADLSVGVVWFNAMTVVMWALVWLLGWGANAAYSLLGGYRFLGQALAYELPLMFALTGPPLAAASLRVGDIVRAQQELWFVVLMPAAFVTYLAGIIGMAFWRPLSAPAGADLAGGVTGELSGMDRLALLSGRYAMLAVGGAFAVPLFLGGGHGPVLPPVAWSVLKVLAVVALLVWFGHRWPRVPPQRLMTWGWLVLLPLVLVQIIVVGVVVVMRG